MGKFKETKNLRRRIMAKSVTALKAVLKREIALLEKIKDTLTVMAHKESKVSLKEIAKAKRAAISTYKKIIKASEKCPAIKKPAAKKAATKKPATKKKAACKTKKSACKTTAKKKPAAKKAVAKKPAAKKVAKKKPAAKKPAAKKAVKKKK